MRGILFVSLFAMTLPSLAGAASCPDLGTPEALSQFLAIMVYSSHQGGLPDINRAAELVRAGQRPDAVRLLAAVNGLPTDESIMTMNPPIRPGYVQAVSSAGVYAYVLNGCQRVRSAALPSGEQR